MLRRRIRPASQNEITSRLRTPPKIPRPHSMRTRSHTRRADTFVEFPTPTDTTITASSSKSNTKTTPKTSTPPPPPNSPAQSVARTVSTTRSEHDTCTTPTNSSVPPPKTPQMNPTRTSDVVATTGTSGNRTRIESGAVLSVAVDSSTISLFRISPENRGKYRA